MLDAEGIKRMVLARDDASWRRSAWTVITPNRREFGWVWEKMFGETFPRDAAGAELWASVARVARELGVSVVLKGEEDIICGRGGDTVRVCTQPGSLRRVGGLGDVLAGVAALFAGWARKADQADEDVLLDALYGACLVTRVASKATFDRHLHQALPKRVIEEGFAELANLEGFLK